jgi:signal transduction histidine kinase
MVPHRSVRAEGDPRPLSPGADLSAYRIVQEALTNVVRHAAPASAELTLRYRSCEVEIGVVIADDQALERAGFRVLVETAADMEVLGEANDGAEAVALARPRPSPGT